MSVLSAKILWLAGAAAAISSFLDDAETEQSGKDWEKSDADSMDRKRSAVEIFLTMENCKYVDNQEFMQESGWHTFVGYSKSLSWIPNFAYLKIDLHTKPNCWVVLPDVLRDLDRLMILWE